jgi:hypothetical protein
MVLFGIAILSQSLVGCAAGVRTVPRPAAILDSEAIALADDSVLSRDLCQPPCWNGIAPGDKMTLDDALALLMRTAGTGDIRKTDLGTAEWKWLSGGYPSHVGTSSIFVKDGLVQSITLALSGKITVKDIIASYGIPSATRHGTRGVPEHPWYWLAMYYPTRGLVLDVRVETWSNPVLELDSMVVQARYERPYLSAQDWLLNDPAGPGSEPWPGFGPLPRRL